MQGHNHKSGNRNPRSWTCGWHAGRETKGWKSGTGKLMNLCFCFRVAGCGRKKLPRQQRKTKILDWWKFCFEYSGGKCCWLDFCSSCWLVFCFVTLCSWRIILFPVPFAHHQRHSQICFKLIPGGIQGGFSNCHWRTDGLLSRWHQQITGLDVRGHCHWLQLLNALSVYALLPLYGEVDFSDAHCCQRCNFQEGEWKRKQDVRTDSHVPLSSLT